jgi:hypothetical protein
MKTPFGLASDETKSALVIMFPPTVKGLFNSDVHQLVRDVQDLLEGVYVTYAFSSGSSPDLRDSIAAARFGGCESAVVVPVGATDPAPFDDTASKGDWLLTGSQVDAEHDAPALVDAYLEAVADAGRAA